MATITLELPDDVVDQLQARGLAQAEIEVIIVRWLREFVEKEAGPAQHTARRNIQLAADTWNCKSERQWGLGFGGSGRVRPNVRVLPRRTKPAALLGGRRSTTHG